MAPSPYMLTRDRSALNHHTLARTLGADDPKTSHDRHLACAQSQRLMAPGPQTTPHTTQQAGCAPPVDEAASRSNLVASASRVAANAGSKLLRSMSMGSRRGASSSLGRSSSVGRLRMSSASSSGAHSGSSSATATTDSPEPEGFVYEDPKDPSKGYVRKSNATGGRQQGSVEPTVAASSGAVPYRVPYTSSNGVTRC